MIHEYIKCKMTFWNANVHFEFVSVDIKKSTFPYLFDKETGFPGFQKKSRKTNSIKLCNIIIDAEMTRCVLFFPVLF